MIVFVTAMLFPVCCHAAVVAARFDEVFKNWTAGIASFLTALAVVAGGVWAYYKFIQGRTFRPRISVEVLGQWRTIDGAQAHRSRLAFGRQPQVAHALHVRICVKNIGAAKVTLKQRDTGLTVSLPNEEQPVLPHSVGWGNALALHSTPGNEGMFKVFEEHEWIEPGETISEHVLLDLGRSPTIAKLEVYLLWSSGRWERISRLWRLICGRSDDDFHRKDVADFTRVIIPPDSTMIDSA